MEMQYRLPYHSSVRIRARSGDWAEVRVTIHQRCTANQEGERTFSAE